MPKIMRKRQETRRSYVTDVINNSNQKPKKTKKGKKVRKTSSSKGYLNRFQLTS